MASTTEEDTPVTIDVIAVSGASDVDTAASDLRVASCTQPATGGASEVLAGNRLVRFTPSANFNGQSTFACTIEDGAGGSVDAAVTVTVTGACCCMASAARAPPLCPWAGQAWVVQAWPMQGNTAGLQGEPRLAAHPVHTLPCSRQRQPHCQQHQHING